MSIEWAAGFLEGEGCFRILRNKRAFEAKITTSQKHSEPLEKLQSILGGRIYFDSKNQMYNHHLMKRDEVRRACIQLGPHLVKKREQAELLVEFMRLQEELRQARGSKTAVIPDSERAIYEEHVQRCSDMKRRGIQRS